MKILQVCFNQELLTQFGMCRRMFPTQYLCLLPHLFLYLLFRCLQFQINNNYICKKFDFQFEYQHLPLLFSYSLLGCLKWHKRSLYEGYISITIATLTVLYVIQNIKNKFFIEIKWESSLALNKH